MQGTRFFGAALAFALSSHAMASTHKLIAKEIPENERRPYKGMAIACSGVAKAVANSFLPMAYVKEDYYGYCKKEVKKRLTFPASNCNLHETAKACADLIYDGAR